MLKAVVDEHPSTQSPDKSFRLAVVDERPWHGSRNSLPKKPFAEFIGL